MYTSPSMLAKKTKAEIINEYQELLQRFDEIKQNAQLSFSAESAETAAKAKGHTTDSLLQSVTNLKGTINQQMSDTSNFFHEFLNKLLAEVLNEIKKFDDLQKAIEVSKQTLEAHHHIEVAADAFEKLTIEISNKKTELERDVAERRLALEDDMAQKRREWEREQEMHAYDTKLSRVRDEATWTEEKKYREKLLAEREQAIERREAEVAKREATMEDVPTQVAREITMREKEIGKRLEQEWSLKLDLAKREWEAEKRVTELRAATLEDEVKRLNAESVLLRKDAETAQKKSQELAVKVIESAASKMEQEKRQEN